MGASQYKAANFTAEQQEKLNQGKPVYICDGINITMNPITKKL